MRRILTLAVIGLAFTAAASTDVSAQGRQGGRRAGVMDTARARRMDSIRAARGDTAFRRRLPDSVRQHRIDSLRAAGALDNVRGARRGRGGLGPAGRPGGPMGGRGGLMGIQLNDNEKAAVKTINEKYRGELEQLREANKGAGRAGNPQLMEQVRAIGERQQAEIRGALTAEHQKEFDANIAKRKEQMEKRGRRGQRPPAHRDR